MLEKIESHKSSVEELKSFLEDGNKKVYGVFYTNSFFSKRYLSRAHLLLNEINIEDKEVRMTLSTRIEPMGLLEVESTLEMFVKHGAGDVPGLFPEEGVDEEPLVSRVAEPIGAYQRLYSVDLAVILKDPEVTYKVFTIADSTFTLVSIKHKLEDDFEQQVNILLSNSVDKLYLFSHFFGKTLEDKDAEMLLELIVNENITGKAIVGVEIGTELGTASGVFPLEEMISAYTTAAGDYTFGTGSGYIQIPYSSLSSYKVTCVPTELVGSYTLHLTSEREEIKIYFE